MEPTGKKVLDTLIQDKPWAILPAKLDEIDAFIKGRIAGDIPENIRLAVAEAGKSGNRADERYTVEDGIAVIPVYGVLAKRMNLCMEISGGTSTELLQRDFLDAMDDPRVEGILLDIDSPGGSVDGTKDAADLIYGLRGEKPVVAYANGLMASAALWIGTAADKVVANATAQVGSIGVAMTHYDFSESDNRRGVTRTVISAGKYKRIASDEKPLTDEGKAYLQGLLDSLYTVFIDSVAQNRGTTPEKVLADMADGKVFIGAQAQSAGLVDAMGTIETAKTTLKNIIKEEKAMDIKNLTKQALLEGNAALFAEIKRDGATEATAAAEQATAATVKAERENVCAVASVLFGPEAGATLTKVVASGIKPEQITELKGLFGAPADGGAKSKILEQLTAASQQLKASGEGKDPETETGDFMKTVEAYQEQHKCTYSEALAACQKADPSAHEAWLESVNQQKR